MSEVTDKIMAQIEFEEAYKAYTRASQRVYNAKTEEERKVEKDRFQKVSERFDNAYKKFTEAKNS